MKLITKIIVKFYKQMKNLIDNHNKCNKTTIETRTQFTSSNIQ